jgi:hypothetical protein
VLSNTYKIVSNILLSRLTPQADKITGDYQCGFQHNQSTTDQIFCICLILEEKRGYNRTVHQLFTDFQKAYVLVQTEVLYNTLTEFSIPKKLVKIN